MISVSPADLSVAAKAGASVNSQFNFYAGQTISICVFWGILQAHDGVAARKHMGAVQCSSGRAQTRSAGVVQAQRTSLAPWLVTQEEGLSTHAHAHSRLTGGVELSIYTVTHHYAISVIG